MKKSLFVLTLSILSAVTTVHAREVDNFMAWGVPLKDASETLNAWTRKEMSSKLAEINKHIELNTRKSKKYAQCSAVAYDMMGVFFNLTYQKIEEHIDESEDLDSFPRKGEYTNIGHIRASIIEKMPFFVPLARIININGIYVGSDKFGHFTSFGRRYFKRYLKLLGRGYSKDEALHKVLVFGLKSELGIVGKMASKVASYGDYEANYQGFQFLLDLCSPDSETLNPWSPKLVLQEDGLWALKGEFKWENYINPDMDESFNNSTFASGRWKRVRRNLREYCPVRKSEWVENKFRYYQSIYRPSLAKEKLLEVQDSINKKVTPQYEHSLERVCLESDNEKGSKK